MVAHGFSAVEDVFDGERNFFVAYGRAPKPQELVRELGATFEIMNTNIKRWSVGSPMQAPLDSLLDLMREHHINASDVEKITVRVSHQGANTVNNRNMPDICMQHMCAVMLLDGTVTFKSSHDDKRMSDPKVLALRRRVELLGDDALTKAMPSRQGIVEVRLRDGNTLKHHTKAVRGTSDNPMTRDEVDFKSYDLLAPVLGKARARTLCDTIWNLEKLGDARTLRPLLTA
jgi:2-methylcitrate dehydratase PrpD